MKFKKLISYSLLLASSLLIFSCHSSIELMKRKYRHGYYIAYTGENKNPLSAHEYHAPDNFISNSIAQSDFLKHPVINSENLVASIARIGNQKLKEQKIKFPPPAANVNKRNYSYGHERSNSHHFLPVQFPADEVPPAPVIPLLYKIAIICLLLCLLSLVFAFASFFFPTVHFLTYIGATFPETWFAGIILALSGLIKYRKNPDLLEPKRSDRFSRTALVLQIIELVIVPLIIIATFLILLSITPLITLVSLLGGLSLVSFIFSIIGLIRVLRDPQQSRNHRIKALIISVCNLIPIVLAIAWFIAVGTAIAAAAPFLFAILVVLAGR